MTHSATAEFSTWPRQRCLVYSLHLVSKLQFDIHLPTSIWYTPYIRGVQAYFPWVVFFTGWLWVFMSHLASSLLLILFEAACWLGSMAIPVGSSVLFHCLFMAYRACLISWLLQLSDVRVHYSLHNHYVVRSVLEEASLRMGNKSVLRT